MFAKRFIDLREKHGLFQKDIAEQLVVEQATISNWERGQRVPDSEMLVKIANMFHVTVDYLLGNDDTSKVIKNISKDDIELHEKLNELVENEFDRLLLKKYANIPQKKKKIVEAVIDAIIDIENK